MIYELSIKEAKSLPDFTETDMDFVRITLNGLVIDRRMLSLIGEIGSERLATFSTDDFLVINAIFHEQGLTDKLRSHTKKLLDMDILEHAGRNKYVLARSLYATIGKSSKELILKHIEKMEKKALR